MSAPTAVCDLDAGLRRLHLPTIRRMYSPVFEQAEKEGWTYREVLEQLVSEEIAHRTETRIQRSTRKAHFPFLKTIEEFDFEFQRSVKRQMLGRFLGPELVAEGRSLVLLGEPGRGKTHLAIAVAYKAIQNGYDARFTTAAQMLNELHLKRRPIVITSNKEPESWGIVLHDPDLAEAIVDRLQEHGEIIRLKGKSYRRRRVEGAPA